MLFVFCNFLQFYISKNKFNDFCFLRIHTIIKIPFFILTSKNLSQIKREKNFFFKIISTHCIFTNPSLKDKKKKKRSIPSHLSFYYTPVPKTNFTLYRTRWIDDANENEKEGRGGGGGRKSQ